MTKHRTALTAAFLITLVLSLGMFVIGASAALNKNSVPLKDSPGSTSVTEGSGATSAPTKVDQMQNLISQYQQREQQYQQREQQYQDQVNSTQQQVTQLDAQLQQYQQLLQYLVNRGIIQVDQQGRIFLPGDR
jgi:peptidoglycan hydrolase CwlO-like protein